MFNKLALNTGVVLAKIGECIAKHMGNNECLKIALSSVAKGFETVSLNLLIFNQALYSEFLIRYRLTSTALHFKVRRQLFCKKVKRIYIHIYMF